jgi:hypothetical protein
MVTKTEKRTSGSAGAKRKSKKTPKFLLVKDADKEETEAAPPAKAEDGAEDAKSAEILHHADEDGAEAWPEREGIRDGLVDQVSARFGIPQDVAIRAVNDMLRLS